MTIDTTQARTEAAVDAYMGSMRELFSVIPHGRWEDGRDLVRYSTGLRAPRFNGLCVLGPSADEQRAAAWLADLADAGTPRCILARPTAPDWVGDLAARHGLTDVDREPLMLHEDPASVTVPATPVIEPIDPDDPQDVATGQLVFADGFGGPVEVLGPLMAAEVLRIPGNTGWIGRVDAAAVTVGFGAVRAGHVGVFNIATPEAHRRRGYGRAVTAQTVAAGVAAGAHTAYLQASAMGYPVYERMGFRTAETWQGHYPGA